MATPHARIQGNPAARLTIFEYSDFQCPACAHIQPTVQRILELYKGKIRLVFKYYPLTMMHKNALGAAHAAQCAAEQNQFWPYGDELFAKQTQWATLADPTTSFMAIAQDAKLDTVRYATCVADPSKEAIILADVQEGKARQVSATPTFFVGDQRLLGGFFEADGARTIERELRK